MHFRLELLEDSILDVFRTFDVLPLCLQEGIYGVLHGFAVETEGLRGVS